MPSRGHKHVYQCPLGRAGFATHKQIRIGRGIPIIISNKLIIFSSYARKMQRSCLACPCMHACTRTRWLLMMKHSPVACARSRAVYRYTKHEIRSRTPSTSAHMHLHAYAKAGGAYVCVCVCPDPTARHILSLTDAASKSKTLKVVLHVNGTSTLWHA